MHEPFGTDGAFGQQDHGNKVDVVRKTLEKVLRNEIPEAMVSHMVETLMPEKESVVSLGHRNKGCSLSR